MANMPLKTEIRGICNVKLQFLQHAYKQDEFFIIHDSVSDVVIGDDLFERFEKLSAWAVKPDNIFEVKPELFPFNNRKTKKKMSKSNNMSELWRQDKKRQSHFIA